jgi:hypothetical protein
LRAEKGEGGDAGKGGKVAGPGIVSNENSRASHKVEEFGDGTRRGDLLFAGGDPPIALFGIAHDTHLVAKPAEAFNQALVALERPDANGLTRAGVHKNGAAVGGG